MRRSQPYRIGNATFFPMLLVNPSRPPEKSFRVGVDGFNMAMRHGTGIATYGRTLTHALRGMGLGVDVVFGMNISKRTSPALREVIFFDSLDDEHVRKPATVFSPRWWTDLADTASGLEAVEIALSGRVEHRGFAQRLPAYDRLLNVPALFRAAARHYRNHKRFLTFKVADPPDVMHWTYPLPIRMLGAKNIYTIHDLVPLRLPYTTLDDKGMHFRLIRDIVTNADLICTVSEASARDIAAFFGDSAGKLFNTYQALMPDRQAPARTQAQIGAQLGGLYDLRPDGYFLFFGSLEPKKNIGRIIEAFLATPTSRRLVIVGSRAWKAEHELRFLQRGVKARRVKQFDYLPQAELTTLIRGARAVLFPSLSEGFGLPVLEALSLGTPVLTSGEGALPEVVGDAACFADAYDSDSIARGIARLDTDDEYCARLRESGPIRAEKFTMPAYQERLSALYARALS